MSRENDIQALEKSEAALSKEEKILKAAEGFQRVEEKVEPGYTANVPDFALGKLEVEALEMHRRPAASDPGQALKKLEEEAAATKADLESVSELPQL